MFGSAKTRASGEEKTILASRRCPVCGAKYPPEFVVCPKDTTPLQTSSQDDPLIGEVLAGSFCIIDPLGTGGMGRVYVAEHVRLPRRFAVKVMHEELSRHPEAMERFEREAQAAASIASEHVVEMVDVVQTRDGLPCLVSEYLEGEDLSALCDRLGKVPLGMTITIGRQICRGLAAAHAARVIHRDLKPSNVFLLRRSDERIHVKILDFGVAKLTDGKELTRTGSVLGTPAYMSPEQARGSARVDVRADIYAVGALLYKLLTGSAPFPDEDASTTLRRVLSEDPRRPRELERSIPQAVELLIQRAMARSPSDRPASALELERELAQFDDRAQGDGAKRPSKSRAVTRAIQEVTAAWLEPSIPPASVEMARRAKGARPAALGLALAASLVAGIGLFVVSATTLLLVTKRAALTPSEKVLLGVITGIGMLFAAGTSMGALVARWRSAWAIERLAWGLRIALLTLLSLAGFFGIGWRAWSLLGQPVSRDWLPFIDMGIVVVPMLVSTAIFIAVIRKAQRHS